VVKVERHPDTSIKVSGSAPRLIMLPISTPFSAKIINALHYGKVKMSTIDLYVGPRTRKSTWEFTKPRCLCKM